MERKKATSFEDLIVWQKAHAFVLEVYRMTDGRQFPFLRTLQKDFASKATPTRPAISISRKDPPMNDATSSYSLVISTIRLLPKRFLFSTRLPAF